MLSTYHKFKRRQLRVRAKISKNSNGKLRFSIFRANCHIYAQIIDDSKRMTLASASTIDKELKGKLRQKGERRGQEAERMRLGEIKREEDDRRGERKQRGKEVREEEKEGGKKKDKEREEGI